MCLRLSVGEAAESGVAAQYSSQQRILVWLQEDALEQERAVSLTCLPSLLLKS